VLFSFAEISEPIVRLRAVDAVLFPSSPVSLSRRLFHCGQREPKSASVFWFALYADLAVMAEDDFFGYVQA
jgi:hypothetical protein